MHKFTIKHAERESRLEKAAGLVLAIAIGLITVYGLTASVLY